MPTKKIEEAEEVTRCPECNSGHLSFDYERGELICEECGLVLTDQMIDQGPEWRAFDVEQGEKRARTGAPMTYTIHDKGLSTTIGWKNKDSYGKSIPTRHRAQLSRVGRKEIGRTYRFMTRELKLKLMPTKPQDYVSRFCSELKLSGEVQSRAVEILKDAQDKELTSGRGPTGVAAAAIYISSILCNERRTQREVADVAGVTEVTIRNRYKELTEKLGIKVEL